MSDLREWYKDRDFPEVKASNADIIAVIERPNELQRVIDDHNSLVDENISLRYVANKAIKILRKMDCDCGFEEPLGEGYTGGTCYRCLVLNTLKDS